MHACRGARLNLLSGHTDQITSHQFDASMLASASLSGHVRVWDMRAGGRCVHVLEHGAAVHAFQFDGSRLVSPLPPHRTHKAASFPQCCMPGRY